MNRLKKYMLILSGTLLILSGCFSATEMKVKEFMKKYGKEAFADFYDPSYYLGKDAVRVSEMNDAVLYYEGYDSPEEGYAYVYHNDDGHSFTVAVYREFSFDPETEFELAKKEKIAEGDLVIYAGERISCCALPQSNVWVQVKYEGPAENGEIVLEDQTVSVTKIEVQLLKDAAELN